MVTPYYRVSPMPGQQYMGQHNSIQTTLVITPYTTDTKIACAVLPVDHPVVLVLLVDHTGILVLPIDCPGILVLPKDHPGILVLPINCPGILVLPIDHPGILVLPIDHPGVLVLPIDHPGFLIGQWITRTYYIETRYCINGYVCRSESLQNCFKLFHVKMFPITIS